MCVFVLYSPVSLSSGPFLDILHCLPRAVGVPYTHTHTHTHTLYSSTCPSVVPSRGHTYTHTHTHTHTHQHTLSSCFPRARAAGLPSQYHVWINTDKWVCFHKITFDKTLYKSTSENPCDVWVTAEQYRPLTTNWINDLIKRFVNWIPSLQTWICVQSCSNNRLILSKSLFCARLLYTADFSY